MNVIAALICAAWWLLALLLLRNLRNVRLLSELPVPERDDWPDVAVIMPARNEAATLDAGVRSRLGDEYPGLKLVLVNDRSDDDTGAVADTIAAEDPRLTVIHNSELPAGWLGKVHALQVGVQSTDTPWILFSDVDVHVGPHAMRAVVHYAESEGFDVVAVLPTITSHTLLTHALQALFLRILWAVFDVKALQNPKSKFGIGVGAFTLVRRTALEASPGLSAIRMEVADDLMLGRTLKASGARCSGLNGAGATSVDIYPRARDFVHGAEKNAWGVSANFNLLRGLASVAGFGLFEFGPWLVLALAADPMLRGFAAATCALALVASAGALVGNGRRGWPGLLYPLGSALFLWAMLRGTLIGFARGGLQWRDSFYTNEAFREFHRERDARLKAARAAKAAKPQR